jgi:hypothetical protein
MTPTLIVDRCKVLDRDIEKFRRLHETADDPVALMLLAEAITDLKAEKASLHPEDKK